MAGFAVSVSDILTPQVFATNRQHQIRIKIRFLYIHNNTNQKITMTIAPLTIDSNIEPNIQ
jgi:hypothetical protein